MRLERSCSGAIHAVLATTVVWLLAGCGGYVLEGRAVEGQYSGVEFVDTDDPRLDGRGMPSITVEVIRDPDSLGRKVVATGRSVGNGDLRIPVGEFGAGFLEEEWELRILGGGAEYANARVSLPFDPASRRLLVTVRKGDGRTRNSLGVEAERQLQGEEMRIPNDSVIFR